MIPFSNVDSEASDWSKLCLISLAVNGGGINGFSNERYFGRQLDKGDRLRSFACQIAVYKDSRNARYIFDRPNLG